MPETGFWSVNVAEAAAAVATIAGLIGLFFAAAQLRSSRRAQETQLLLAIQDRFRAIPEFSDFLYRLDYAGEKAWRFDPATFAHSAEEKVLDATLYELAFVGSLVKTRDIQASDLVWLKSWIAIVLRNPHVQAYLRWLKEPDQRPHHDAFIGAIHLYEGVYGEDETYRTLTAAYRHR